MKKQQADGDKVKPGSNQVSQQIPVSKQTETPRRKKPEVGRPPADRCSKR